MSDAAKVESEKQLGYKIEATTSQPKVVSTPIGEHKNFVTKITKYLAQVGHPQSPEQVSPQEAEATLVKLEEDNPAVEVITDVGDRLGKMGENITGDVVGSNRIYEVKKRGGGLLTLLKRAVGIAKGKRVPLNEVMTNSLYEKKKAA